MREAGFRAWMTAGGYTPKAVASRLSRCRTIEARLRADLDRLDLTRDAVGQLKARHVEDGFGAVCLPIASARRVEHVNGWRFILGDQVWRTPGVVDASESLAQTAAAL